jgi:hypothetical protein
MFSFSNNWGWFAYRTHYSPKHIKSRLSNASNYSLCCYRQEKYVRYKTNNSSRTLLACKYACQCLHFLQLNCATIQPNFTPSVAGTGVHRYWSCRSDRFAPARWDWERRDATYSITNQHIWTSSQIPNNIKTSKTIYRDLASPMRINISLRIDALNQHHFLQL